MKTIDLTLSIEDTNLILEALGALPFARVYALIGRIQDRARTQLEEDEVVARATGHTNGTGHASAPTADGPRRLEALDDRQLA